MSMPSSARIVVTATGWVMYGSPLLRRWPRWYFSAIWYARSRVRRSAFWSLARTMRNSGSRTGLGPPERGPPRRAKRALTRLEAAGAGRPPPDDEAAGEDVPDPETPAGAAPAAEVEADAAEPGVDASRVAAPAVVSAG